MAVETGSRGEGGVTGSGEGGPGEDGGASFGGGRGEREGTDVVSFVAHA